MVGVPVSERDVDVEENREDVQHQDAEQRRGDKEKNDQILA
jgi:hypothetical protein